MHYSRFYTEMPTARGRPSENPSAGFAKTNHMSFAQNIPTAAETACFMKRLHDVQAYFSIEKQLELH